MEFLYKFTGPKYNNTLGRFDSFNVLSKNQLWFCPASKQDNPDDLRLKLDENSIISHSYQEAKAYNSDLTKEKFQEHWDELKQAILYGIEDTRDHTLLCSFTKELSSFMWEKYAERGSGFCCIYLRSPLIQYLDKQEIPTHDVRYGDYCVYKSFSLEELQKNAYPLCFTKAPSYMNEHEVRSMIFTKENLKCNGRPYQAIPPIQILYTQYTDSSLLKLLNEYCIEWHIPLIKANYKRTENA